MEFNLRKGPGAAYARSFIVVFIIFVTVIATYMILSVKSAMMYNRSTAQSPDNITAEIAGGLVREGRTWTLSDSSAARMDSEDVWAMLISDSTGTAVWHRNMDRNLLERLPERFTFGSLAELAHMNYLGYPTFTAEHPEGLVVAGFSPERYINVSVSQSKDNIRRMQTTVILFVFMCIIIMCIFSFILGWKNWKEIRTVMSGIEDISEGKSVHLKETGQFAEVAACLNTTSDKLQKYSERHKRWIAGVSHDIRTPLTIILGQADRCGYEDIRSQAIRIRELITDLNMFSQLESDSYINKEEIRTGSFIRDIIASFADGTRYRYPVTLDISDKDAASTFTADSHLLSRAINNILYNSAKHNPSGCSVNVSVQRRGKKTSITIQDDGNGAEAETIMQINNKIHSGDIPRDAIRGGNGLGLYIVSEIIRMHGGTLRFSQAVPQGLKTEITI